MNISNILPLINLGTLIKYPSDQKVVDLSPYNNIYYFGPNAFSLCDEMEELVLPPSLLGIDKAAFNNCHSLRVIHNVPERIQLTDNPFVHTEWFRQQTAKEDHIIFGGNLLYYRVRAERTVRICLPEIKHICSSALILTGEDTNEWELDLSSMPRLESIAPAVLSNKIFLAKIIFNKKCPLNNIPSTAFAHCWRLEDIVFPNAVRNIHPTSIEDTPWKTQHTYDGITSYNNILISPVKQNTNSSELDLSRYTDITAISESAFAFSAYKSIILPPNLQIINKKAFEHCHNLQSVTLPQSLKYIGEYAFGSCQQLAINEDEISFYTAVHPTSFYDNKEK